jgi:hypothetical protein
MRRDIWPAGWPLRHFSTEGLEQLFAGATPRLVEISKETLRVGTSLKVLGRMLTRLRERAPFELSFAATTDFVTCSALPWDSYRHYLGVQVAQAKFLKCSLFRILIGKASADVSSRDVIQRVADFCEDLRPLRAAVEIHATLESDPSVLEHLLRDTPALIVVDLENMQRADLSLDQLLRVVPRDRVAYFHQRNLGTVWTEHEDSLADERRCHEIFPDGFFLWEPKAIDAPDRIQELYREYRSAD